MRHSMLLTACQLCLEISSTWQLAVGSSHVAATLCLDLTSHMQIGFNVETVEYKNISFTVWDVGGQDKVCPLLVLPLY